MSGGDDDPGSHAAPSRPAPRDLPEVHDARSFARAQRVAHIGAFVWEAGATTTRWSDELFRIAGLDPGTENPDQPLFRTIHPDDVPGVRQALLEVQARVTPAAEGADDQFQYRIVRPDGSVRTMRAYVEVVHDAAGRPQRILGLAQDVTELVEATRAVQRSEERYRALVERSHEVITLATRDGRRSYVSPAVTAVLGYLPAELAAVDDLALAHPDDTLAFETARARVLAAGAEGGPVTTGVRLRHKNGRWRWMEATLSNRLADPGLAAIVVNYRDVTDRHQLEEQVQQAHKMEAIGRLAGGIAHDFNNMLSAITGFTNLALASLAPAEPARAELAEVVAAAERAMLLTRQLLAFSRQQVLKPVVFDLGEQVQRTEHMLRRVLGEDIEVVVDAPPGLVQIKADLAQIEQVLLNLTLNARDAMPRGGRLAITVSREEPDDDALRARPDAVPGPHALITVSDTGHGMTPVVAARIFEPFFTTRGGSSTGLGLSTAFGVVAQSHGQIVVDSTPGVGSRFRVYLPVSREAAAERPDTTLVGAHGCEFILLVEDEPAVRRYASRVLRERGYQVLEAGNGNEALRIASEHDGEIQLLFTDVVMPGMSGRQLAERLAPLRPTMRVLYTSGYTSNVIERHGLLDAGRHDLVEKPVAAQAMLGKVRELLDRSS